MLWWQGVIADSSGQQFQVLSKGLLQLKSAVREQEAELASLVEEHVQEHVREWAAEHGEGDEEAAEEEEEEEEKVVSFTFTAEEPAEVSDEAGATTTSSVSADKRKVEQGGGALGMGTAARQPGGTPPV